MSTQRDPIYEEFFTGGESIKAPEALIREAVQNSLDAALSQDEPVFVSVLSVGAGDGLAASDAARYFDGLTDHVLASGLDQVSKATFDQSCAYVVYEDWNTTGLTGDINEFEAPAPAVSNNFYYFFRAEGRSGKSDTERGRWGVGKYVFPMSSMVNTFFALTRVADGSTSSDRLLGKAIMRNHVLPNGDGYEPDGWWAKVVDDAPLPIGEPRVVEKFRTDWNIVRPVDSTGTSIVIPYADASVDYQSLAAAVASEYHLAVLTDRLRIRLATSGSVIELTKSNVLEDAPRLLEDRDSDRVRADLELLAWHLNQDKNTTPDVAFLGGGAPHWTKASLVDDKVFAEKAQLFESSGRASFVVPVEVRTQNGASTSESYVTVLLERRDGWNSPPAFYREGILLTKEQDANRIKDVRAIVIVDDAAVAGMFGDAENPAHTKWSHTTRKFRGKYKNGFSWLQVVRLAPTHLLKLIAGESDEADVDLASELFSLPSEPSGGKGGPTSPGGEGPPTPPTPPETPSTSLVQVGGIAGGFTLRLSAAGKESVGRIEAEVAYDIRRGNPFAKYRREDFEISSMHVSGTGYGSISRSSNVLRVDVADPETFELKVEGFDINRDIIVSASPADEAAS